MRAFDIMNGDKEELLNNTNEPLKLIKMYDYKGKKFKINARCELCYRADFTEDDELYCAFFNSLVADDAVCDDFNITRGLMQDIYLGCLK